MVEGAEITTSFVVVQPPNGLNIKTTLFGGGEGDGKFPVQLLTRSEDCYTAGLYSGYVFVEPESKFSLNFRT